MPQKEWVDAVTVIEKFLDEDKNNVVVVDVNKNHVIQVIYLQSAQMRKLYYNFGEVLEFDGTHGTNHNGMACYTFYLEDNDGVGQPVAHGFIRDETMDILEIFLKIFRQVFIISWF